SGRYRQAELVEDVHPHAERVVQPDVLVQAGDHVDLPVGLPASVDLGLQVPLGHLVLEVRHQVEVVADRQDPAAGDELLLVRRVGPGENQRRFAATDQRGPPVVVVGERREHVVEGDVGPLGQLGPEHPVGVVRVAGVILHQDREGERLGGLELDTDVVVVHGADPVTGQVITSGVVATAATGGEYPTGGQRTGARQHVAPGNRAPG